MGARTHQPADQGRQVRIVVGVDPRPVSRAAMAWANALAGWLDAEVIVVHALDPTPSAARAEVPAPSIATQIATTLDRDWCASLREAAIPYRLLVREGAPVGVVQDVVEQEAPDLLVVGRHTGVPAGRRGSTSLGVLAQPLVPTLVVAEQAPESGEPVPASGPGIPARRTLVGIDGSAPSLRALDLAVTLARAAGGDIVAVAAVEDAPVFPLGPAAAVTSAGETDAPARTAEMLARASAPARALGLPVHTICRRGTPTTVLSRLAVVVDADLIAVGTHGVGTPEHPLLGSVSRRLVCCSPRPILVTPTPPPELPATATH